MHFIGVIIQVQLYDWKLCKKFQTQAFLQHNDRPIDRPTDRRTDWMIEWPFDDAWTYFIICVGGILLVTDCLPPCTFHGQLNWFNNRRMRLRFSNQTSVIGALIAVCKTREITSFWVVVLTANIYIAHVSLIFFKATHEKRIVIVLIYDHSCSIDT